jgi:tetratricopeptide (TPR) repeat protein
MKSFEQFVREIHRRSVWQVMGVFLAASWGVLQVVEVLTETAGLPDWTPTMALVLLLLGLPMCIATAFVQGAPPDGSPATQLFGAGDRAEDPPANLAPGTGSLDRPSTRPTTRARLFTWRNALFGGLGAFTLLGLSIFAYFVMWATGFGPVGSLEAQGVFEEREPVVLADFATPTGDPGIGRLVTETLRVDLVESSALSVLPETYVADAKRRMGLPTEAPVTPEVGREIALRDGIKAIIEGEVGALGGGYVLTASLVEAASGNALAAFRETAEAEADLLTAIDKLSERIREKAGESLRVIRSGESLEAVTTSSLEALEAYTEAVALHSRGREQEAIALIEAALELDPEFGMAWRKLAVVLQNSSGDPARADQAVRRAFELRGRMTETERWLAEAYYFSYAEPDDQRALQAYERVLDKNPDEPTALNNLAIALPPTAAARAIELLERAVEGPGATFVAHQNLVLAYWNTGRPEDASAMAERLIERFPNNPVAYGRQADVLTMQGHFREAHERRLAASEMGETSSGRRAFLEMQLASEDFALGRLAEAREHIDEAVRLADASGQPSWAVDALTGWAYGLSSLGDQTDSVEAILDRVFSLARIGRLSANGWVDANAVATLALAGQPARVQALVGEYEEMFPPSARSQERRQGHALMEWSMGYATGDWEASFDAIDRLQDELACNVQYCWGWWERGRTLEAGGRLAEAKDAYLRSASEIAMSETRWFPLYLPDALERLASVSELLGDTATARDAARRLVELWADADAELVPRRQTAEARLEALGG